MSLFNLKLSTLHSGDKSKWLIDCNALTELDLQALALLGRKLVGPFGAVYGIPEGGLRFAKALLPLASPHHNTMLIVDDVSTTGKSLEEAQRLFAQMRPIVGLVIFNRGKVPTWARAIWTLNYQLIQGEPRV